MKKALLIGLLFAFTAQAETVIERVDFQATDKGAQVMVSFDLLSVADLFKEKNPVRHMEFRDEGLNFVQNDPDEEMIAMLLARYSQAQEEEKTHWSRNADRYKTAAIVAAIGTAVAVIVSESKESSGRDVEVTAGGNVNINTGTVGGNNGNQQGEDTTFEGLE